MQCQSGRRRIMNLGIHFGNNQLEFLNWQLGQALAGAGLLPIGPLRLRLQSFHFDMQEANYDVPDHEHPYYEISIMRRGAMNNFTEFGNVFCTPENGFAFFVPPATVHRRIFSSSPENINTSLILTISAETWDGELLCSRLPELIAKHHCRFALTTELAQILKLLDQQLVEQPASAYPLITTLLNAFLLLFFQKYFPELFQAERSNDSRCQYDFKSDRIQAIKIFVERSLNSHVTLNDCEAFFGMSMRHLNRIFHAATGQSIRQYLVRRQLETAEMLLLTSNCSITEIAQATHFDTAARFSRFFHHHRGVSPTEFRRRNLPHS